MSKPVSLRRSGGGSFGARSFGTGSRQIATAYKQDAGLILIHPFPIRQRGKHGGQRLIPHQKTRLDAILLHHGERVRLYARNFKKIAEQSAALVQLAAAIQKYFVLRRARPHQVPAKK